MLSKSGRYYYDQEAIKEPAVWDLDGTGTEARALRAEESHKAMPTAMKNGIRPRTDKQRRHGRRHAGFNDRWGAMTKQEQCSGMRNKRSVWTVATKPYSEAHFATYPPDLIEPCILAGCPEDGTILDPFFGAGTTGLVADRRHRHAIGIELNPAYVELAGRRIADDDPLFGKVEVLTTAL